MEEDRLGAGKKGRRGKEAQPLPQAPFPDCQGRVLGGEEGGDQRDAEQKASEERRQRQKTREGRGMKG